MNRGIDRIVLVICLLSLLGVGFSLLNWWFWFGLVNWLLIALGLALGYGREGRRRPILFTLIAVLLGFTVLFIGLVWAHDPEGDLTLVFGFPAGTAFFVYGIWPFGIVAAILYAVVFDRFLLPKGKLERLLGEFGRQGEKP